MSIVHGSIDSSSSASFAAVDCVVIVWRAGAKGLFGVAGTATTTEIAEASGVTVTTTGTRVTVRNTATAQCRYAALIFA